VGSSSSSSNSSSSTSSYPPVMFRTEGVHKIGPLSLMISHHLTPGSYCGGRGLFRDGTPANFCRSAACLHRCLDTAQDVTTIRLLLKVLMRLMEVRNDVGRHEPNSISYEKSHLPLNYDDKYTLVAAGSGISGGFLRIMGPPVLRARLLAART